MFIYLLTDFNSNQSELNRACWSYPKDFIHSQLHCTAALHTQHTNWRWWWQTLAITVDDRPICILARTIECTNKRNSLFRSHLLLSSSAIQGLSLSLLHQSCLLHASYSLSLSFCLSLSSNTFFFFSFFFACINTTISACVVVRRSARPFPVIPLPKMMSQLTHEPSRLSLTLLSLTPKDSQLPTAHFTFCILHSASFWPFYVWHSASHLLPLSHPKSKIDSSAPPNKCDSNTNTLCFWGRRWPY